MRGGFNFASVAFTRKGVIDSQDPTQITWSQTADNPGSKGYRMACSNYQEKVFWLGGAGTAYNFNGQAYAGGGGVEPLDRILQFNAATDLWDEGLGTPFSVMDLRGIAKIASNQWIICGGMESNQQVSNKTYLLTYDPIIGGLLEIDWKELDCYPNPAEDVINISPQENIISYKIISQSGQLMDSGTTSELIDVHDLSSGVYLLIAEGNGQFFRSKFVKK
ncbi:T9SS type A sorting domain-containing protein [Parvicella tangerina]|uniref:Secretion system C-terminal sorting domain-containing protein n=1 Tax=Parvicella tangerina TaxID=2829795 RepID=A0A916NE64_9FLAO|nr:T9SS type A sorting domain-containing protein [Parvicella tangerina]CAG5086276.1 hypothetical protein CRYO30217_03067 [Parvicella tangerina]